ncbi:MAG: MAPEG family protein [Roseiarcus sp.]
MSSIELVCLELSVLLFIAHVVCQAVLAQGEFGQAFLFSPRDEQPPAKAPTVGRATRALHNFTENYGPFVAMDLALIATGHTGGWGAALWLIARIVYLPLYLSGVVVVRTAVWSISIIGLLMMLGRLAFS